MKNVAYLLIALGFLAGAFFAVEQREGVTVPYFLGALALGVVGVVMIRVARREAATRAETIRANLGAIETSLASVVGKVQRLDETKEETDVYDLRHVIDREFPDDLDAFVQARYSLVHTFGLQSFADVMNPFAAGERYLNRVWSASCDGYINEAHDYVVKAREQFESALEIFRGLAQA
ncbi:MAG: hypothetical protein GY769_15655 [bacterium]|nr:hypothetical protein [bacterium]